MENTQEKYPNLISAEILADSLNQFGERITTMKLIFPRIILAEFNTHRMFNRNSASSRAIPFKKMVKMVQEQPFIPIAWQKHHSGMQGSNYHTGEGNVGDINYKAKAERNWLRARDFAVEQSKQLYEDSLVTKQICNRLLEPFMYHTVLVTATEWENFFELRCPSYKIDDIDNTRFKSWKDLISFIKDRDKVDNSVIESYEQFSVIEKLQKNKGQAEIHIMDLAEKMWNAYNESTPKQLEVGQWHIPFGDRFSDKRVKELYISNGYNPDNPIPDEYYYKELDLIKVKIATARCARLSYETLGDNPEINYEKDIKLHDDLLAMKHFSPFEHCCVVPSEQEYNEARKGKEIGWFYNLKGFKSYRFSLDN